MNIYMSGLRTVVVAAMFGCLLAAPTFASDISVTAVVEPSVVPVGAEARLVVTVNGKFRKSSQPQLPTLDDFSVYQAGSSQSFRFVNGQRSASLQFTYVLVPRKEGRYTIEPIRFETDGNIYTAEPVTIEVVKSSAQLPSPSPQTVDSEEATPDSPIFIRANVDKDTVYVSQQVTWTLGFYTDGRVDLLRSPEYSPPNAEGFWVEDLPPQQNYYKSIKGTKYLVNEIRRGLFPTAPGVYTIGSARVEVVVDDFGTRSFDDFFNRRLRTFGFGKPRTLTTDEIAITVLPLPRADRPKNFSGLVGRNLDVALRTDKQVVEVGEPVNVTLEIRGEGNFKTMAAAEIPEMPGFKFYESGSTSEVFKNDYVVSGRKRTEFVLIPQVEGATVIPPVQMSYFDPKAEVYKTIQTAAVQMEVKPGTKERGRQVVFTGSGEDIEVLGRDIHYIHPAPAEISTTGSRAYPGPGYLALHAVPLLAVILSLAVERRRRRWSGDVGVMRARRAAGDAEKKIGRARDLRRKGKLDEAFAAVSLAIRGYLADKMNKSASGLTSEEISTYLLDRGVSEEERERVMVILKLCDGAQYSASSFSSDQADRALKEARDAVRILEKRYLS